MKFSKWCIFLRSHYSSRWRCQFSFAAQNQQQQTKEHPRYKLIDLGTFAGPNSFVNGRVPRLEPQGDLRRRSRDRHSRSVRPNVPRPRLPRASTHRFGAMEP